MEIEIIPKLKRYEPLIEMYPPQLANKFLPEWYKKQTSYKRGDVNTSNLSNAWQLKNKNFLHNLKVFNTTKDKKIKK